VNSRETIFAALFALVSPLPALQTASRRLKHWTDVAPPDQPALFQAEGRQTASVVANQPTKWTFRAEFVVYVHANTADTDDVITTLNNLVDSIVAALEREPATGRQTLGGLVYDCRISGDIETDEGRLGEQAVAIIPIEIIANA
jgi:hypothetical protein